jgi:DNA-binding NarL/FixJ family response regulator
MRTTPSNTRADLRGRALLSCAEWRAVAAVLKLSPRELEIVQCIFDGKIEGAIALKLNISAHTVHTHVKRLYRKLGVCDRCELVIRVFATYMPLARRSQNKSRGCRDAPDMRRL